MSLAIRQQTNLLKSAREMLNCPDCDLDTGEKTKMQLLITLRPFKFIRAMRKTYQAREGSETVGLLGGAVASRGSLAFGDIDWENFDWEAAKEFWVEVIKVIAEVIKIFI